MGNVNVQSRIGNPASVVEIFRETTTMDRKSFFRSLKLLLI